MLKRLNLLFLLFACGSASLIAQGNLIFSDDYSSPQTWTQVGTLVEVTNGRVEYQNDAPDGEQRRVYKPLGAQLNSKSTEPWCLTMEFYYDSVLSYYGSGHMLVGLTAGTQDPHNDCPDIPCTGYPAGTQDAIGIVFRTSTPFVDDRQLLIRVREGTTSTEYDSPGIPILYPKITYYLKLEHPAPGQLILSVFLDSLHNYPVTGSPTVLNFPSTITNLHVVQHGNTAKGYHYRRLNGYLDNLSIYWCDAVVGNEEAVNPDEISVYPNPSTGYYEFTGTRIATRIVTVFDLSGKPLLRTQLFDRKLDLSGFPNGVYMVRLEGESNQFLKLIKQD